MSSYKLLYAKCFAQPYGEKLCPSAEDPSFKKAQNCLENKSIRYRHRRLPKNHETRIIFQNTSPFPLRLKIIIKSQNPSESRKPIRKLSTMLSSDPRLLKGSARYRLNRTTSSKIKSQRLHISKGKQKGKRQRASIIRRSPFLTEKWDKVLRQILCSILYPTVSLLCGWNCCIRSSKYLQNEKA
ncbi:hypothetical protein SDJN02_07964, partial [Cucurbita argyrosperma subsp. argyrosperma]